MTTAVADVPFTPLDAALARLDAAVSPLVGIVTRTVSTTHTTDESPVPNCAAELASAERTLGASTVEYGSGAHPDVRRARAAAIGEALERYSAMFVPEEQLRLTTALALGPQAVPPQSFALFHSTQHATAGFPFAPFTADTRLQFIEGVSLVNGGCGFLPAQLVYLRPTDPTHRPIGYSTSSGLACAPTLAEATLAALLELVERDAVMLAWKCGLSLPRLDWSDDDELQALDRRFFRTTGVRFSVVDGSRFLGVPIAIAVVHGPPASRAALAVGAGAAADIGEAWLKAVVEAFGVYRWLGSQAASTPDAPHPEADSIVTFDDHMRFYAHDEQAQLASFLDASTELTATRAIPPLHGSSPAEQIEALVAKLARHDISAYAVDVTAPDVRALGLRVVRVVAPELCALDVAHRGRFLGGARLVTAAHEAGLAPTALSITDLNPHPHPFP